MVKTVCRIAGLSLDVYSVHTLIIGSGAAALNCAEHLVQQGQRDVVVVTDRLGGGTSNNSGSDKQTYYKMGVVGDTADSPFDHAQTLCAGGCMHGDLAYVEAANSLMEFSHLVQNGVPFPHNEWGAYVGYKTDHDPKQRATSAGPKTSRFMVERSLEQVRRNGTSILDRHEVIRLLTHGEGEEKRVVGVLAIRERGMNREDLGLTVFHAQNVVMATGGPGEMYAYSVYPRGQIGNHGMAFEIGAVADNLTESQFGLASTSFRWNLSGTYQQVIPDYFSTAPDGSDRRPFLTEYFPTMGALASAIFLKGYQWPFDPQKIEGRGSSLIDFAVFYETAVKGRRVFMDFTTNPTAGYGLEVFRLVDLSPEAYEYLRKSDALIESSPIERLRRMNPLSIELYQEHGVDITNEPLEVAVCAQHCNGGFAVNRWWESNIRHLFFIGEIAGTHGVKRPGGAALNAGQVGGLRAAEYIARVYSDPVHSVEEFLSMAGGQIRDEVEEIRRKLRQSGSASLGVDEVRAEIQERMSRYGAQIRSIEGAARALEEARRLRHRIEMEGMRLRRRSDLLKAVQNEHLCLTHIAFLTAIKTLLERGSGSRGSHLALNRRGRRIHERFGEEWNVLPENERLRGEIVQVWMDGERTLKTGIAPVRPVPKDASWYETTWAAFRDGKIYR